MTDPFYPAKSGDPILADTWNNMQVKLRDEVRTHTHRGADDGKQLDGDSIVPTASLKVNRVDASVALTVKSIDVFTRLGELATSITGLGNTKLNVSGGGIAGALTVTGNLGIGTTAPASRVDIAGTARVGVHGSNKTLYVTGDFAPDDGAEFRHTNGSQGVGIGYNTVYAAGSIADQDLYLKARGGGSVRIANGALVPKVGNAPNAGIQFPLDAFGGTGDSAFIRYYAVNAERAKLLIGCDNDPDDSIGLWQSGAERLTVINGRIGIGTADPQGALDVRVAGANGWDRLVVTTTSNWGDSTNQYVTIGAGGSTGIMLHNAHVSWIAAEARASIRYGRSGGVATGAFWDVGTRAGNAFSVALNSTLHTLWLKENGNVGIGTTDPTKRLSVFHPGPGNNHAVMELRGEGTHSWGVGLVVRTTAGQDGAGVVLRSRDKTWQLRGETGATATGFQITEDGGDVETGSGFGTPRFHISAGGNVGIGTTTPASSLDIAGAARVGTHGTNRVLYVSGDFSPDDGAEFRHSNGSQGVGIGYNTVYATGYNADQDLNLKARGNGNVRITNGAIVPKVGNSPNAGIQFPFDPGGGGGDQAFIRYYVISGETTKLLIGCENDGDDTIGFWQAGAERMTVYNGNVGIGTTAAQTPLHIQQRGASGIRLQEFNNTGRHFNIYYEGQGTVVLYHQNGAGQFMTQDGLWRHNSDISLKENISGVSGVLDRVLALRPVSFDWKATGTPAIGLVAQEVETLFPELVDEVEPAKGTKLKGVAYETLGVLAVAALQEMKRQYDEKLQALEARLQALPVR